MITLQRTLSPSGAPIQFSDLIAGLKAQFSEKDAITVFKRKIADYFGCKDIFLLSSGKAAMLQTLKTLSFGSPRREVIIPAYSSFCLASIVAASGLSVKLCDIDMEYLDFDLEHLSRLVNKKTLAVIPVHLFGLVTRIDEIRQIVQSNGTLLIEDAAQAAGAKYRERYAGTIGDVGIFSLGRGKSISTVHGGVIAVRNPFLADIIKQRITEMPPERILSKVSTFLSAVAIALLLRPEIYIVPANLPFLNLGANTYEPDFKSYCFSDFQAGIGNNNFSRLDTYNRKRTENALFFTNQLKNHNKIKLPKIAKESRPCFTRFPVCYYDKRERDHKFDELYNSGLGVSKNFPFPLNEISGFKDLIINISDDFPNSKKMCEILLTLPTHIFVNRKDMEDMIGILTS